MTDIKFEPDEKGRITKKVLSRWIVYTIILAFFMAVLYGTTNYYFDNIKIGPIVIDLGEFFFILGLAAWALVSFFIFKNK
jgi:polyferredoxin